MTLAIGSVVSRHLGKTDHFKENVEGLENDYGLDMDVGESIIGIYQNPLASDASDLIFSNKAIYILEKHIVSSKVYYSEIVSYESLDPKDDLSGIRIILKDGFRFIRCAGKHGKHDKFSDVYNLLSLIRAIVFSNSKPE